MLFEFLIPKRPVSTQTRDKKNYQRWKNYVSTVAKKSWAGVPHNGTSHNGNDLHLTLIYLCDEHPTDVDNIIKPIQDALIGIVYDDDLLVSDVESHRRPIIGTFDITKCPELLLSGILSETECVYVRVTDAEPLENYLP